MRTLLTILAFFITGLVSLSGQDILGEERHYSEREGNYYKPYEVVLTFHHSQRSDFLWEENGLIVTSNPQINSVFRRFAVDRFGLVPTVDSMYIVGCTACDTEALVETLSDFSDVFKFVELHYLFELTNCASGGVTVNDPIANQGLLDQVSAQCAWEITTGGDAVVGLVDATGNGLTNSDIQSKVISHQDYTGFNNKLHGHNMGGLIAAETDNNLSIPGLGFDTELRTYNISSHPTAGFVSGPAMVSSINQARIDGVNVINMSFTWFNSGSLKQAVDAAHQAGITLVAAAGNNSYSHGCGSNSVICVTSVDENDAHAPTNNRSSSAVDLSAPDRGYRSLSNSGTQIMYRGTSQSTALVSATAALMYDVAPLISPAQVENFLECSADDISNVSNNGTTYNGLIGAGRLNMYRAVQQAEIYGGTLTGPSSVCPNSYYTFSVPAAADANYTWSVTGATITTGQNSNVIGVSTGSSPTYVLVGCTISVGNCSQTKARQLYNGCGGGYFLSAYPNPTNSSDELNVSMNFVEDGSSGEFGGAERAEPTDVQYTLYNPYGRAIREVVGGEEITIDIQGLQPGFYTLRGVHQNVSLNERIEIR